MTSETEKRLHPIVTRTMEHDAFPVGGPRQAVYDALRNRGFVMDSFGDKIWTRADGLKVHIYGTGSRLTAYWEGAQVADGPVADVLRIIDEDWKPKVQP